MLDHLKQTHPAVVNELIPAQLTVGQVQRVLQNLLSEGIAIRNLAGILEKVSDYSPLTKNPDELSEYARRALGPQITKPYQSDANHLRAITIDPASNSSSPRASGSPPPKSPSSSNRSSRGTSWKCSRRLRSKCSRPASRRSSCAPRNSASPFADSWIPRSPTSPSCPIPKSRPGFRCRTPP